MGKTQPKSNSSRKRTKKENADYLPTLEECMSSPSRVRELYIGESIVKSTVKARKLSAEDELTVYPSHEHLIITNPDKGASDINITKPKSIFTDSVLEEDTIPVGTPVLALWRTEYYPAMIIECHERNERVKYKVRYCDNVERVLPRNRISTPRDPNFTSVKVHSTIYCTY